jgi:hypothetical protein
MSRFMSRGAAGIVCIRPQLIEIAWCLLQGRRDMKKAPFEAFGFV